MRREIVRAQNWRLGGLGAVMALALACGRAGQSGQESPGTATEATARVDPSTAGEIAGMVHFDGEAPKNAPIKMNADPVCQRENTTPQFQETYEVKNGALANAFVYVKTGLGHYSYDPPSGTVTITQKGCRYHPHVFGIRVGQPLEIVNDDPTLHNIHALPSMNQEFNVGQPLEGMKTRHMFTTSEVMVPFKCDVHGWMNAYVGVMDHPYFSVTNSDGRFVLKGVPPGTRLLRYY